MKTLVISLYESYPPKFGAGSVSYNFFKYLPQEKYLIQLGGISSKNKGIIGIPLNARSRFEKMLKIVGVFRKIKEVVNKINPDLIVFEGASWVIYYLFLYKVLKGKKRRFVYHNHNVEYEIRKKKENRFIALISRYAEGKILKEVDFPFVVSQRDAILCKKLYNIECGVLPNGVDFNLFSNKRGKSKVRSNLGERNILFMGGWGYPPNREAINLLIKKVIPMLPKDIKLIVTGGKVPIKKDFLIDLGCIPINELVSVIHHADICVAPIFSGSGTRLKIIEYLAAAKPVIATSKGVEGLGLEDGRDLIIENKINNYPKIICDLLKNDKKRKLLGLNGQKSIKKYSWERIVDNFVKKVF